MGDWSVDPDGVLGVLAGVDDQGSVFQSAHDDFDAVASSGGSLVVDGRDVLSQAWEAFVSDRRLVPGKLMHAVRSASGAVGTATIAIVTGDDEMADDQYDAQQHAEQAWGIAPAAAYQAPPPGYW